jgi:hypothetical protein
VEKEIRQTHKESELQLSANKYIKLTSSENTLDPEKYMSQKGISQVETLLLHKWEGV